MPRPFTYSGPQLREIAFPLGGIGTGCVSLDGRGALRDWEIFNRPGKGNLLEHTFPVLWAKAEGSDRADVRVIQGPRPDQFVGPHADGKIRHQGDGLPHFAAAEFEGRFPFARVRFDHPRCPLKVSLEAFNPFIPLDEEASGMPLASLTYRLRNDGDKPVQATVAWSLRTPMGFELWPGHPVPPLAWNEVRQGTHGRGIYFTNDALPPDDPRHGTAALATDWPDVTTLQFWYERGIWFDMLHDFWDTFSVHGEFPPREHIQKKGWPLAASLGLKAVVQPGQTVELPFVIAWSFPLAEKYWGQPQGEQQPPPHRWTPYYATKYPTAWDAVETFLADRAKLTARSRAFEHALFDSTLPPEVIESVANTASILHSPTVLRLEDGTMWAWEGCFAKSGCCPGSCTHVWNYALTQAFLFPALHRTMRRSEYEHSFEAGEYGAKGAIAFRIPLPLSEQVTFSDGKRHHAAADGQLGGVVQLYRDWRFCGDDDYLRHMWPAAKKALEYAWHQWDTDRDGLIDGDQHNTYDINFQGPNPLTQCFYLAALTAGARMARYLGDDASAAEYERVAAEGRRKTREHLFNGEFLIQTFDCLAPDAPKYQLGRGCLTDQVFGQLAAHVAGLGYILDQDIIRSCVAAIFRCNFRDPLDDHANCQRIYAVSDESGLLLCSWPNGGRPRFPFPYSDEVWTGIEYQAATHMVYEGMVDEALRIVRAIRVRHDGTRRNPYDEFECGHHYARALASWGLLLALSGFRYDAVDKTITVTPRGPRARDMRCLFTTGSAWGTFHYDGRSLTLDVAEGSLNVARVVHPGGETLVPADKQRVDAKPGWTVAM